MYTAPSGVQHRGVAPRDDGDARFVVARPRSVDGRSRLRASAWAAAFDEVGLLEHARRKCAETAEHASFSLHRLEEVDARELRGVRRELAGHTGAEHVSRDAPLALVGGVSGPHTDRLDAVLLEQFGQVARTPVGGRFVALAISEQPDIAVIHDDLREPDALIAAVLIRVFAPATVVLLVTDDPEVLADAERAGVDTVRSSAGTDDLDELLARLAA